MKEAMEHKLGSTVTLDLPVSRGGRQALKVKHGSSCTDCALSGLGHTMCRGIRCERDTRTDGHPVVYEKSITHLGTGMNFNAGPKPSNLRQPLSRETKSAAR